MKRVYVCLIGVRRRGRVRRGCGTLSAQAPAGALALRRPPPRRRRRAAPRCSTSPRS